MYAALLGALLAAAAPGADDEFSSLLLAAEAARGRGAHPEALTLAHRAAIVAFDDPPRKLRARLLAGDVELSRGRPVHAARLYRDAAHLAIDDPASRAQAVAKRRAALARSKSARRRAHAAKLGAADQLVARALAQPRRPGRGVELRAQLLEAAALYEKDGDRWHALRARAASALVAARSGDPSEGAAAEALATRDQPPGVRGVALEALLATAGAEEAMGLGLRLHAARTEHLPIEVRLYQRPRELERACADYDADHGSGACARLEHALTGRYSFTDYSREPPRRELSAADLERVHRQLLPALQDCVRAAAKGNEEHFRGTDLRVAWAVRPDGRAAEAEIEPKRYEEDLGPCLRERLSWARYPRFTSEERRIVTIPYRLD